VKHSYVLSVLEYFTDPALPDKVKDAKIQRHAD